MATDAPSASLLRPLAEDLRVRREKIKLGGGAETLRRRLSRALDRIAGQLGLDDAT